MNLSMSEYAEIVVGKLSLYEFRNYLDSKIVSLFFSKRDLVVIEDCNIDDRDKEAGTYTKYVYKTTVRDAKQRLDACGFGLKSFEKIFNEKMLKAIDYEAFLYHLGVDYDEDDKQFEMKIRKSVSFRKWRNAMKKIICYEMEYGNIREYSNECTKLKITTECDKVIFYSLKQNSESFYALNTEIINYAYIYRLILECCADDEEITLDFSNLVNWADDCIPKALKATGDVEKTIVLVEGSSDKDILEFSMSQLFPHLSELFYFMDFNDENGGKRDGGTSFVIKNLKAFYFSKIKAKFIAIFDNDAEGYISKCTLLNEVKNWPENFRILLYPQLDRFRKYPTLAPNGKIVFDDINKKAASIELYLPDSIIMSDNKYYPIEWECRKRMKDEKGIEKALYQGVISYKDDIKKQFHEMRNRIEKGKENFCTEDWKYMKLLLETIIFAFNKE